MSAKRRLAAFAALLLALGLVVIPPQAAQASGAVGWSADVTDAKPNVALTGKDGSITVAGCSTATAAVGTETFSAAGGLLGSTPRTVVNGVNMAAFMPCGNQAAAGKDGTVYGIDPTASPLEKIAAYNPSGTKRWSSSKLLTSSDCADSWMMPDRMRIGSDSNLYVTSQMQSCSRSWYLTSFSPAGVLRWQVSIGTQNVYYMDTYSANSGGVVIQYGHSALKYVGYDGSIQPDAPFSSNPGATTRATNASGIAMVVTNTDIPQGQCSNNLTIAATSIDGYGPNGQTFHYAPPACTDAYSVVAGYWGGVAYTNGGQDGVDLLTVVGPDGSLLKQTTLPATETDRTFLPGDGLYADTNGNLVLERFYNRQGDKYRGAQILLLDGTTLATKAAFYTESIDNQESIFVRQVGMSPGKLDIVMITCAMYTCTSEDPLTLVSVNMAELGMDYPRGAVLGWGKVTFSNMAVAGDSYSSGVGSLTSGQTYLAGSDTGTDECRRSPNAYGRVLDANPVVKLQMPAASFVACSGATTAAISTTASSYRYQTEVAQYRQIPTNTKAIFVTIGGNDVNFGRLGALCIFLDCSAAQYQQEFAGNLAALQPKLQAAYTALLNRASGATLYVLGYPHILPLQDCTDTGSGAWWFALQAQKVADPSGYATNAVNAGLTPAEAQQAALGAGPTISNDEAVFTNTFENNLNLAISNAVDAVNASYPGRIVYVSTTQPGSPLEGKQLCSASPDFNGLDGAQSYNTFHPNAAGQADMAQVAYAALAAHQPQYVVS